MTQTLLITAAGTGTGYAYALACARTLRNVSVVTADLNRAALVSATAFAEAHVQVDAFDARNYEDCLRRVFERYAVTHYLPLIDAEIRWAAEVASSLPVIVIGPHWKFASMAGDKVRYEQALGPHGIASPRLVSRHRPVFPCFAKERGGFGGRLARVVQNETELSAVAADCVIQEFLSGPEFTVDCFPSLAAAPFCSIRERLEVKAGVCTKARIAPNPDLESIAQTLATSFDVNTPFCFQAIRAGETYVVTDINARLGAGTQMSAANGSNFFAAHLAAVFGGDPLQHLQRHRECCFVTRQYVEYVHCDSEYRP